MTGPSRVFAHPSNINHQPKEVHHDQGDSRQRTESGPPRSASAGRLRQDLETLRTQCSQWGAALGLKVEVRQTDDEAEMVRWMHQAVDEQTPVVMNPAAFTHYSYALADAAHMVGDAGLPLMEVHISNPSARDEFRKRSVISPVATGTITGMGFYGYKLALDAIAHLVD